MSQKEPDGNRGSQLTWALQALPVLGEDLYLGMQAMNLGLVDGFLEDLETQVLQEYMERERTPSESASFLSALSQVWLFGLYEVLRTWRQRVQELVRLSDGLAVLPAEEGRTRLDQELERARSTSLYSEDLESDRSRIVKRVATDPDFVSQMRSAYDHVEALFRRIEALRVYLAKHEVPKAKLPAFAPGYGRISMDTGSIYYQVLLRADEREVDVVSRRDLADGCRELTTDRSRAMLPREIRSQLASVPDWSYGVKKVAVTLRDGRELRDVFVQWDREIVGVRDKTGEGLDARDVVEIRPSPSGDAPE